MDYEAWRCCRDTKLLCPVEGCPKSYGCARDKGWKPGDPSPRECQGLAPLENMTSHKNYNPREVALARLMALLHADDVLTEAQLVRLADLCVYHENTPALDQLTALSLAMQAGEEDEILKTANLSRVTDAGRAHPLILERGIAERRARRYDEVREKNEAYWLETKRMWTDTLGVFVLGRMWRSK